MTQFAVQAGGIGNVVPVWTSAAGLQQRRRIYVSDTERVEIRNERSGIPKAKACVELQAIRRNWDAQSHYSARKRRRFASDSARATHSLA